MEVNGYPGGFVPAHDADLEQAVIGSMLIDKDAPLRLLSIIKDPEVFYKQQHSLIYSAVKSLFDDGKAVDLLTVADRLRRDGSLERAGGDVYLIECMQQISSTIHLENHCEILLDLFGRREMVRWGSELLQDMMNLKEGFYPLMDKARQGLEDLEGRVRFESIRNLEKILDEMVQEVKEIEESDGEELPGVPTGFEKLNEAIGGYQPGLHILAARPGMGKTAFMMSSALAGAKSKRKRSEKKHRILIFSLEMEDIQLAKRMVANESNIHSRLLYRGGMKKAKYWDQFLETVEKIKAIDIEIIAAAGWSLSEISYRVMKEQRGKGVDAVWIDYLQLIEPDHRKNGTREQEVSAISRGLVKLSLSLHIPVIALSQLSRKVEERGDKVPRLSDLRESGSLEQDAMNVYFLYRAWYYEVQDDPEQPLEDDASLIVAKGRNCTLGRVPLKFDGNRTRYWDPESSEGLKLESIEPNDDPDW